MSYLEYRPVVSVIVPTYNRARCLVEAIDSVLHQTYRPIELIVVDDGSTDNTKDVVRQWHSKCEPDSRLAFSYLYQENRGACVARNRGFEKSHGELIVFHDSDDSLDVRRIELQVKAIRSTNADLCSGSFRHSPPKQSDYHCPAASTDPLLDFLRGRIHGGTPCWMVSRCLFQSVNGYNENLPCYQDLDLTFRLLAKRPVVAFAPESLTIITEQQEGRISSVKFREPGLKAIIASHKHRVDVIRANFCQPEYIQAEGHTLIRWAILAHGLGHKGLSIEFHDLAKELGYNGTWGNTFTKRLLFSIGGIKLIAFLLSLAWRSGIRQPGQW